MSSTEGLDPNPAPGDEIPLEKETIVYVEVEPVPVIRLSKRQLKIMREASYIEKLVAPLFARLEELINKNTRN